MALLSAHIVNPNDRFSMFAPVTTVPSSQRMAAPTLNLEYGEYDIPAAASAAAKSLSSSFIVHSSIVDTLKPNYIPLSFQGTGRKQLPKSRWRIPLLIFLASVVYVLLAQTRVDKAIILTPSARILETEQTNQASEHARYIENGRIFEIRSDQMAAAEVDPQGNIRWTREFPTLITALSAGKSLSAWGQLDGRIIVLKEDGSIFPFSPSLSEIAPVEEKFSCIYGVGISPEGENLLVIYGRQPQYLIAFSRNKDGYKAEAVQKMKNSMVSSGQMIFSQDGRSALLQSGDGLIYFDAKHSRFSPVTRQSRISESSIVNWNGDGFAALYQGTEERGILVTRSGLPVIRLNLQNQAGGLTFDGTSIAVLTGSGSMLLELNSK